MKRKKFVAIIMVLVVSLFSGGVVFQENIEATSSFRYYWRHDCSSSDPTSYHQYALFQLPNASTSSSYSIIGTNDFKRDANESIVSIGLNGSGFIVDDHVIATNAHCVFSSSTGNFFNPNIYIMTNTNQPVLTIQPKFIHIPRNYTTIGYGFDYALIYVEEDLSEYKLNMGIMREGYDDVLYISGFPSIDIAPQYGYRFKSKGYMDWTATNQDETKRTLWHTADIAGGCSGGPLFIRENINTGEIDRTYANTDDTNNAINQNENYTITVVGINFCEGANNTNNGSIRITEDLLHFYLNNDYLFGNDDEA